MQTGHYPACRGMVCGVQGMCTPSDGIRNTSLCLAADNTDSTCQYWSCVYVYVCEYTHQTPSLNLIRHPPTPTVLVWERKLLLIKSFQIIGWKGRWNWAALVVLFLLRMGAGLLRSPRSSLTGRGVASSVTILPRGQSKWFASLRLQRRAITLK